MHRCTTTIQTRSFRYIFYPFLVHSRTVEHKEGAEIVCFFICRFGEIVLAKCELDGGVDKHIRFPTFHASRAVSPIRVHMESCWYCPAIASAISVLFNIKASSNLSSSSLVISRASSYISVQKKVSNTRTKGELSLLLVSRNRES